MQFDGLRPGLLTAPDPEVEELDDRLDPAAPLLISMSASNALAVYPQLARGLFGADGCSPELVEHYSEQLARLLVRRRGGSSGHPG